MSSQSKVCGTRRTFEFMKAHNHEYAIKTICRVIDVAPDGYYAWLRKPLSDLAKEDTATTVDPRVV